MQKIRSGRRPPDGMICPFNATPVLSWMLAVCLLFLSGCTGRLIDAVSSSNASQPTQTVASVNTITPAASPTPDPTASYTPTGTPIPTATPTPTITPAPSTTPTATAGTPQAVALMRAFCRYGPGKAYLYSHELKQGDHAEIHGRSYSGAWLWLKPDDLDRHCWAAASVLEVHGDVQSLIVAQTSLPHSTLYDPPRDVETKRDGDRVLISWECVRMTEDDDRGYLIEATVCQQGSRVSVAVQTEATSYEFIDERGCAGDSGGKLYTVEKHGYTDPVAIPWP